MLESSQSLFLFQRQSSVLLVVTTQRVPALGNQSRNSSGSAPVNDIFSIRLFSE